MDLCMYVCIYVYTVFSIDSHVGMLNVDTNKNRSIILFFNVIQIFFYHHDYLIDTRVLS